MTGDQLFAALNPIGGKLTPEQRDAITTRYEEIKSYPELTDFEVTAIFTAWMDNNIWKKEPEQDPTEELEQMGNNSVPPIISKKCSVCGGIAAEGWKYQDQKSFKIICLHCQERQRIQNRPAGTGQRTLSL